MAEYTKTHRLLSDRDDSVLLLPHASTIHDYAGLPSEIEDEYLTNASIRYHEHLGYRMVGWFTNCGYKFHRWYNLAWMEKEIGEHVADQPPVIAFPNLPKEYK